MPDTGGMTMELMFGLAAFAFVTSITPGPNNLMLMASGANFGFRRSLSHMLGISGGFCFMVIVVGMGLAEIFDRFPISHLILKGASVVYLLYLAWRIATAAPPSTGAPAGEPFSFLQAALFQWVNPKAWSMALTAVTVYSATHAFSEIVVVACLFSLINLPSVSLWTLLGQAMRRLLNAPARLRQFNILMAVLLIVSLYPVLFA